MQIKNSLDRETIAKILKGAAIAGTGTAALFILDAVQLIDFGSIATPLIAAIVPIIANAIKEYIAGE